MKNICASTITSIGNISAAKGALTKVERTLGYPEENLAGGEQMSGVGGDIAAKNLAFGYQEDVPVLKDVSFTIPDKKVTAVIGTNGSGKSTLFKLLERLYEPKRGQVFLGGQSIARYRLDEWRKSICMVSQDNGLLVGTLRENICYGCGREIPEEELLRVSKLTGVYDFVKELPGGFDTEVAAGAMNFSGGQRQCIALARALLNGARCIMLDEATSGMDAKRENQVIEAIRQGKGDRTIAIIAHSFASIRYADHVIVLKEGVVEASGSPDEILAKSGNYLAEVMKRSRALETA